MRVFNPVFVVLKLLEFWLAGLRVTPGVSLILGLGAVKAFIFFLAVFNGSAEVILLCAEVETDGFVFEVCFKCASTYEVSEWNGVALIFSAGVGLRFKALYLRSKVAYGLESFHLRVLHDAILPGGES